MVFSSVKCIIDTNDLTDVTDLTDSTDITDITDITDTVLQKYCGLPSSSCDLSAVLFVFEVSDWYKTSEQSLNQSESEASIQGANYLADGSRDQLSSLQKIYKIHN